MDQIAISQALTAARDALRDIPADQATEQQKNAYRLCVYAVNQFSSCGEGLITFKDVCQILKIGVNAGRRLEPHLLADGVQEVKIKGTNPERKRRYRRASLDTIIRKAAESGRPIGEVKQRRRKKKKD